MCTWWRKINATFVFLIERLLENDSQMRNTVGSLTTNGAIKKTVEFLNFLTIRTAIDKFLFFRLQDREPKMNWLIGWCDLSFPQLLKSNASVCDGSNDLIYATANCSFLFICRRRIKKLLFTLVTCLFLYSCRQWTSGKCLTVIVAQLEDFRALSTSVRFVLSFVMLRALQQQGELGKGNKEGERCQRRVKRNWESNCKSNLT